MVVVIVLCMSLSLQPWAHCWCPFNTSLQIKSWPFAFSDVQIFRYAEQLEFALNWWAQLWSQAYICEQWPNCSVDDCTLSGWFPLLIPLADLEVTPFFHCPASVWHRNAAPDCHEGGGYISRERAIAAVSEHSSFECWLEEKFCIKHNWSYWFIPAVPLCIKMSRVWNKFFIAEAWEE